MKVIAVANRKGGVGKSTIAMHLAAGLAIRGQHVCVVDTDSQGHAARLVGMKEENGIYRLLVERAALSAVIREVERAAWMPSPPAPLPQGEGRNPTPGPSPYMERGGKNQRRGAEEQEAQREEGTLWLIPSDTETALLPLKVESAMALRNRLRELETMGIGLVVIDTAPTATLFDGSVYFAADGLIYVTEAESLSFDGLAKGLSQLMALAKEREGLLPPMKLLGILPNKIRPGTKVHRRNLAQLGARFGSQVWTPLALRTVWPEAASYGQLIFSYAPESGEARDAWGMIDQAQEVLRGWEE